MVGASKILTVSYGTFSCTLEGFDEPFNTMKAIAEYFRDLAAEDRYFGAEPPQPDAEMLHRIAEREMARRVEAKVGVNGVILRPQAPEAPQTDRSEPETSGTVPAVDEAPMVLGAALAVPADAPADAAAAEETTPAVPDSVAAKLQRIRAAVATARAAQTPAAAAPEPAEEAIAPETVAQAEFEPDDSALEGSVAEIGGFGYELDISGPLSADETAEMSDAEERIAAEEAARSEAERLAAEEAARAEAERLAAEEAARADAERLAAEEAERAEAERLAADEAERVEAERLAAEEAERVEAERLAAEEAERAEAERLAAEEAERAEAERLAAEEAARAEAERLAAEEAARAEAERLAAEEAERAEAERLATEEAARVEAERLAAEEAEEAARVERIRLRQERRAARAARAAEIATLAATEESTPEALLDADTEAMADADAEDAPEDSPAEPLVLGEEDTLASVLAALDEEGAAGVTAEPLETAEPMADAGEEIDFSALIASEAIEEEAVEVNAAEPESEPEEVPQDLTAIAETAAVEDLGAEALDTTETVEVPDDLPPSPIAPNRPLIRARVIKVRRPEAAPAEPVAEESVSSEEPLSAEALIASFVAPATETFEDENADEIGSALSPEQEAELMAELAALETPELPVSEPEASEPLDLTGFEMPAPAEDVAEAEIVADIEALVPTAEIAPVPVSEADDAEEAAALAPEGDELAEEELVLDDVAFETAETDATEPELEEAPELPADAETEIAAEIAVESPAESVHPVTQATGADTDLSRLMDKADEAFSGSENRRRFSAISHLKAAVAATVADRLSRGGSAKAADETQPFRDDLNQAVRPRRPVAHGTTTQRPSQVEPRPAPLILVSEQRVDQESPQPALAAHVVRPRRVTAAQLIRSEVEDEAFELAEEDPAPIAPAEAASFAEFAEAQGAQGLSELLEAAAAYTAQIEGRPHFSPPQILKKVAAVDEAATREERLQVFGKLLRQGKITKVKRGQYAISAASRYYERRA